MVCDGSMKEQKNAYAIFIGNNLGIRRFTMAQEAVGWPAFSDRSELNGLLTCLDLVEVLAEWRDVYSRMKLFCDNQAAVKFVNDPYIGQTPTWADKCNIDLKIQIRDNSERESEG